MGSFKIISCVVLYSLRYRNIFFLILYIDTVLKQLGDVTKLHHMLHILTMPHNNEKCIFKPTCKTQFIQQRNPTTDDTGGICGA